MPDVPEKVAIDKSIYSGTTLENLKRVPATIRRPLEQSPLFGNAAWMQCIVENRSQFSFKLESPPELTNTSFFKAPCSISPFSQVDFSIFGAVPTEATAANGTFILTAHLNDTTKLEAKLSFQNDGKVFKAGISEPDGANRSASNLDQGNKLYQSKKVYTTTKATDQNGQYEFRFNMIACGGKASTFVIDQVAYRNTQTEKDDIKTALDTLDMLEGEQRLMSEMSIPLASGISTDPNCVQCLVQNRTQFPLELSSATLTAGSFVKGPTPVTPYSIMEFVLGGDKATGGLVFQGYLDATTPLKISIAFSRPSSDKVEVAIAESDTVPTTLSAVGVTTTSTRNYKNPTSTTGGKYNFHFQMAAVAGRVAVFVVDQIPYAQTRPGAAFRGKGNRKHK